MEFFREDVVVGSVQHLLPPDAGILQTLVQQWPALDGPRLLAEVRPLRLGCGQVVSDLAVIQNEGGGGQKRSTNLGANISFSSPRQATWWSPFLGHKKRRWIRVLAER